MTALGAHFAASWGAPFAVRAEPSPDAALAGARFVFSAIRPGQEAARAVDEEVPLKHGVLGQETTGPGGFAMALRTIPAMVGYGRLIEEVAPNALLVNFTNPVGHRDAGAARPHERARDRDLRRPDLDATQRGRVPGGAARAAARRLRRAEPLRVDPPCAGRRPGPPARGARPVRGAAACRRPVGAVRSRARAVDRDAPDGVPLLLLLPGRSGGAHPRLRELPRPAAPGVERRLVARAPRGGSTPATCRARRRHGSARWANATRPTSRASAARRSRRRPSSTTSFEGEGYEGVATAVMAAAVQRRKTPLIVDVANRGAIGGAR